jgi:hypothetical protein
MSDHEIADHTTGVVEPRQWRRRSIAAGGQLACEAASR